MNIQLEEFLEKRKNKLPKVSPYIASIHKNTDRVEKNKVAKEKEFYTKRGKDVPKGSLYHIHYTNDLQIHYMTGGEHNERTQLIYRKSVFDNDFDYYNTLNKQSTLRLEPTSKPPTEDDYSVRRMTRYFAKNISNSNSPAFEVSEDDFESSPLYNFVSLTWYIKGAKAAVTKLNDREVLIASKVIPNLGKLLPTLQYYRSDTNVNPRESILARLGITSEQGEAEQETTTTTSTTTQPNVPAGVPADVYTGGAGAGGSTGGGSY